MRLQEQPRRKARSDDRTHHASVTKLSAVIINCGRSGRLPRPADLRAGLGAAFVASQIPALTDVAERESGLAAGLVDSSFNIGGALGLAIVATFAVARVDAVAGGASPDACLRAVTEGFEAAFLVAAGLGLLGLPAALALLPRTTEAAALGAYSQEG